jgi:hypothetical protein
VKNFPKFVDILGTRYKINYQTEKENDGLLGCRGYCEFYTKEIFVNKKLFMDNKKGEYSENFKDLWKMELS